MDWKQLINISLIAPANISKVTFECTKCSLNKYQFYWTGCANSFSFPDRKFRLFPYHVLSRLSMKRRRHIILAILQLTKKIMCIDHFQFLSWIIYMIIFLLFQSYVLCYCKITSFYFCNNIGAVVLAQLVGRAVVSDARDSQFESSHGQFLSINCTKFVLISIPIFKS